MKKIETALISVYNKQNVLELAQSLNKQGVQIISTGGTAKYLSENGIKVLHVSEMTQFPEIFNGRVKTLHPKIEGGILYKRSSQEHIEEKEQHEIPSIDLVVCNLYPFEQVSRKSDTTLEVAIENIDIGGPTMIRAAAKNFEDVLVVIEPCDYQLVINNLEQSKDFDIETRKKLATKAFAYTSYYDSIIFNYLAEDVMDYPIYTLAMKKEKGLRYGENPHQKGYLFSKSTSNTQESYEQLHGKELSYNNLMDLNAAISIAMEFEEPCSVIIKHSNPCGLSISETIHDAFKKSRESDPVSAFGGIIALNRAVDEELAYQINDFFNECVIAPDYSEGALAILKKKQNRRILKTRPGLQNEKLVFTNIIGGMLVQENDLSYPELENMKLVSGKQFSEGELKNLKFAWKAAKFVKSNAIILAKDCQLIGVGAGQMSRVDAVKIAFRKCKENGHSPEGALLASDAFFPFRDSIDFCSSYKIEGIIQPGGSKKDSEVIEAAKEYNLTMYFTGVRHFKH